MLPQKRNAFSCHLVVRIITANIDLFDAVFHDCKRAWWLFAIMAARLQRHIHFRAFRILGKTCKRRTFCMQITVSRMIPLSNDPVILHDHRTDKRIRIDRAGSFFRKLDRKLHIFLFVCHFITFFVLFTQKLSPGHISLCPGAYPHRNQMAVIVHHALPFFSCNSILTLSSRLYCRLWNLTKSCITARGLYRRWGITPRPE